MRLNSDIRPDQVGRPDKEKTARNRKLVKAGMGISALFCAAAGFAKPEAAPALIMAAGTTAAAGAAYLALTDPWQN